MDGRSSSSDRAVAVNESHVESRVQDRAQNPRHVWVVDHYTSLPSKEGNSRHLHLALELPRHGWTASLIVASTMHPSGRQSLRGPHLRKLTAEKGVQALSVRTIAYGSSLPLRFLGMILFAVNLLRPGMTNGLPRPDAVIGSTVHPFAAWAGWRLAKRHRVPFIYEIRDVWPESLFDLARIDKDHPVSRVVTLIDSALMRHAGLVLSPLPFVDRHLAEMGYPDKPFLWVPNGFVAPQEPAEPVERAEGPFTFMYLGAHGRANALGGLLEAFNEACTIAADLDLRLRLVGDGPLKGDLRASASALPAADRITFEDRIPVGEVITRAREADCLVANLHDLPVYRFGVSLNKYFMYLAAGRPVVVGASAPNNPIVEAGAGLGAPSGDRKALAEAMVAMARTSFADRAKMGRAGRQMLLEQYTWETLAEKLVGGLDSVTCGRIGSSTSRMGR